MMAFLVTHGDYSDYSIDSIFLDKELAEAYVALVNQHLGRYDKCEIEEWEVVTKASFPVAARYFTREEYIKSDGEISTHGLVGRTWDYATLVAKSELKKVSVQVIPMARGVTRLVVGGYDEARVTKVFAEKLGEVQSRYLPGPKPKRKRKTNA